MHKKPEREAPLLVSRDEAARLLNCSKGHVINLEHRGELKPVRLGRLVRHSRQAIAEFIERQAKGEQSE